MNEAFLWRANLRSANLSGAALGGANLYDADLSNANLSNAEGVTNQQLEREAYSLFEATMPSGQKYED
jgi:uncharacterized protein YjbI with pentapeptide repeats